MMLFVEAARWFGGNVKMVTNGELESLTGLTEGDVLLAQAKRPTQRTILPLDFLGWPKNGIPQEMDS